VLGITGKHAVFASMGRDLRRTKGAGAYYAYGNLFGWIEDDMFYLNTVESRDAGTTHLAGPPYTHTALCEKNPANCAKQGQRARAYLNLSYQLLDSNRIYPPPSFFEQQEKRRKVSQRRETRVKEHRGRAQPGKEEMKSNRTPPKIS
jgi:hypothetical protein